MQGVSADQEWFDVVDDNDNVIGKQTRSKVHKLGLKHRAVYIFVINSKKQLFLQKRSMQKDLYPGVWTVSCSGHVDCSETYDDAAQREFREELGVNAPEPLSFFYKAQPSLANGWEFVRVYYCISEGPFALHPQEIDAGRWLSRKALEKSISEEPLIYAPSFLDIWVQCHIMLPF